MNENFVMLVIVILPLIVFILIVYWMYCIWSATETTARLLRRQNVFLGVLVAERYPNGVPEHIRRDAERAAHS